MRSDAFPGKETMIERSHFLANHWNETPVVSFSQRQAFVPASKYKLSHHSRVPNYSPVIPIDTLQASLLPAHSTVHRHETDRTLCVADTNRKKFRSSRYIFPLITLAGWTVTKRTRFYPISVRHEPDRILSVAVTNRTESRQDDQRKNGRISNRVEPILWNRVKEPY